MHRTITFLLSIYLLFMISCSVKKDDTMPMKKQIDIDYLIDQKLKNIALKKFQNTILILLPLSGVNKKLGDGILNACMLSAKEFQNFDIKFQVIDSSDVNLEKNQLYKKFKDHNIVAIIGPVFFNEARQYGALFPNVPIFTFSNNLNVNNDHIFACGLSPQDEINEIFSYSQSKGIDNFLILLPENEYGDEILKCIKSAIKYSNLDLDDIEFIRYKSLSRKNAMKCVKNSGKKAVFILDPILNIKNLDEIQVFTLSSHAISDPSYWDGAIFAFPNSSKLLDFTSKYKLAFGSSPNILDILGYDICNAIFYVVSCKDKDEKLSFLETEYSGCLGNFKIIKKKGLKRDLQLFQR